MYRPIMSRSVADWSPFLEVPDICDSAEHAFSGYRLLLKQLLEALHVTRKRHNCRDGGRRLPRPWIRKRFRQSDGKLFGNGRAGSRRRNQAAPGPASKSTLCSRSVGTVGVSASRDSLVTA